MKKKDEAYVMKYVLDGEGHEVVAFGPQDFINQCVPETVFTIEELPDFVEIWKRNAGTLFEDYMEYYLDVKTNRRCYKKLKKNLENYYIPISRNGFAERVDDEEPFELLEQLTSSNNVFYVFLANKIRYCIDNRIVLQESILTEMFSKERAEYMTITAKGK